MQFLAAIGAFVVATPFILLISIVSSMWRAWWLYPAWAWLIAPLGVPQISFWHFTALLVLIGTLLTHVDTRKDPRPVDWPSYVAVLLMPVFAWVVMRWMVA